LDRSARIDWIEQGLTSPSTQYRLSGRQFYRSKDPTNSIEVLKEKSAQIGTAATFGDRYVYVIRFLQRAPHLVGVVSHHDVLHFGAM